MGEAIKNIIVKGKEIGKKLDIIMTLNTYILLMINFLSLVILFGFMNMKRLFGINPWEILPDPESLFGTLLGLGLGATILIWSERFLKTCSTSGHFWKLTVFIFLFTTLLLEIFSMIGGGLQYGSISSFLNTFDGGWLIVLIPVMMFFFTPIYVWFRLFGFQKIGRYIVKMYKLYLGKYIESVLNHEHKK